MWNDINFYREPPLNQVWLLDCEQQPEELACSIECKKLLLEAGADPTLSSIEIGGEEQTSAFQCALRTGTAVSRDQLTTMNWPLTIQGLPLSISSKG